MSSVRDGLGRFVVGHKPLTVRDPVSGRFVRCIDRYPVVVVEIDRFISGGD